VELAGIKKIPAEIKASLELEMSKNINIHKSIGKAL